MLNIGSTINYDLLAEFLLKFTYVNLPGGVYNKDKVCFIYKNDILAIYVSDNEKLKAKRVFNT